MSIMTATFVREADGVARGLKADAMLGFLLASDLADLNTRHRQIVDAVASEPEASIEDRRAAKRRAASLANRIWLLTRNRQEPNLASIAKLTTGLSNAANEIIAPPSGSASAIDSARLTAYRATSDATADHIRHYRDREHVIANDRLQEIVERGHRLVEWITLLAIASWALVLPMSLGMIAGIAVRLRSITRTLLSLADDDITVEIPSTRDHDEIGDMARAIEILKANAVEMKDKQRENEHLTHLLDVALNNMACGLSMFDASRRLVLSNGLYRKMYAIPDASARPGTAFEELAASAGVMCTEADASSRDSGESKDDPQAKLKVWLEQHQARLVQGQTFTNIHHLSDGRIVSIVCRPLSDGGWVDIHDDVTEIQRAAKKIVELAECDALTGLHNRRSFQKELEARLGSGEPDEPFAVLWIDLDRFKLVNDTYGHLVGDEMLKTAARVIRETVRRTDVVARLGGDEFAIIAEGAPLVATRAAGLAKRLISALSACREVAGHSVSIGASVGIACAPENGLTPEDILSNADAALYRAKTSGRGRFAAFDQNMQSELKQRSRLQIDLGQAIRRNELSLHYQPIVDLQTNRIVALEALLRWTHGRLGPISPADFIPLAEESGLIGDIGEWVLDAACSEATTWPVDALVSVNLSAAQFDSCDVGSAIRSALARTGLSPLRLQLEITESLVMDERPGTWATLRALKAEGVRVALDDFGTGYSSLSYLRSFPFDTIKIDRSFVRLIDEREENLVVIRAIAALARALGMETVAEGVETEQQMSEVRSAGCNGVQGFLLSRPVPASELGLLFRARQVAAAVEAA
ncbi:MAG: EAL domain-containing protein [Hyphomicrobium sp.]|nr:EAL domain-containing protein [Hyphomicrobium sp.]